MTQITSECWCSVAVRTTTLTTRDQRQQSELRDACRCFGVLAVKVQAEHTGSDTEPVASARLVLYFRHVAEDPRATAAPT